MVVAIAPGSAWPRADACGVGGWRHRLGLALLRALGPVTLPAADRRSAASAGAHLARRGMGGWGG
jgi:hypothetical protein